MLLSGVPIIAITTGFDAYFRQLIIIIDPCRVGYDISRLTYMSVKCPVYPEQKPIIYQAKRDWDTKCANMISYMYTMY